MHARCFLIFACLTVTAAAPLPPESEDAVVRLLVEQDRAVTQVGERLAVAALPLCGNRGWAAGIVVQTASQYGRAYRAAAARVFGLGSRPTLSVVLPGGAGERAGLRPGDQIVALDGRAVEATQADGARARVADTQRFLDALDTALSDGTADVTVLRDGRTTRHRLAPPPACRARFEVRAGSATNASAGSVVVQVSSDLVDPDRTSSDLAPLVAHELAHVILRHDAVLERHRGGILPGFAKGGRALRASEIEADRLSVWLLALADYRPEDAIDFWTRFGRANDYGILSDRTHPDWGARVAAIRGEVARLREQRAAGGAIRVPDELRVTSLR